MAGIIFCIIILLIKGLIKEMNSKEASPQTNIYYQDGKPKLKDTIIEHIKKPATVSYIMDHGTSILHTHEYCYMSYLKIDEKMGTRFSQNALFNNYSMTFVSPTPAQIHPVILEAARSYIRDRAHYLGCLN